MLDCYTNVKKHRIIWRSSWSLLTLYILETKLIEGDVVREFQLIHKKKMTGIVATVQIDR